MSQPKFLAERVKAIELNPNKKYILIFDSSTGVRQDDIEAIGEMLKHNGIDMTVGILTDNVEGVKVISVEKKLKENA